MLKSEEWHNKSLGELSTHVINLHYEWIIALEQHNTILDSCGNALRHSVDVMMEFTMEDGDDGDEWIKTYRPQQGYALQIH